MQRFIIIVEHFFPAAFWGVAISTKKGLAFTPNALDYRVDIFQLIGSEQSKGSNFVLYKRKKYMYGKKALKNTAAVFWKLLLFSNRNSLQLKAKQCICVIFARFAAHTQFTFIDLVRKVKLGTGVKWNYATFPARLLQVFGLNWN